MCISKKIGLISLLCCNIAHAGSYFETREAFNFATDQHELLLRLGYNWESGAGLMVSNVYNTEKLDKLKHSYNEVEGWYPLFSLTPKLSFSAGGLVNSSRAGSGGSAYFDSKYTFTDNFSTVARYRYNHQNYLTTDLNGHGDNNDTNEYALYIINKLTPALTHIFESHYFSRVNDFYSANGKNHHWELTSHTRYRINQQWMPYLELQWYDKNIAYNAEAYRARIGVKYFF
ncbi:UNVERIFIED_CONTAM: porin OmpL [Aeromonas hydrophila]